MSEVIGQQIGEIIAWAQRSPFDRSRMCAYFVTLNRILTTAQVSDEQQWRLAAQAMGQVLTVLEQGLHPDERWTKSELAKVFSILLTIMAEAGQYRHEQSQPSSDSEEQRRLELLGEMGRLRKKAIHVAKRYLARPEFRPLRRAIELEIRPLLDSMDPDINPDRFMPFRVIQVGNIVEILYKFRLRTDDPYLAGGDGEVGLLREIYDRKYLRFGTSGVRGRWGMDFTEVRAKQFVQAICEYLNCVDIPGHVDAEDLRGKRMVIGYDSRRNAELVAQWVTQVCLANGFAVDLVYRETPTPALVYYLTDYLEPDEVAGLINCTASHNPPEWQGIKFNPRLGYPAPTSVTDFIAARANELQLLDRRIPAADLAAAEAEGILRGFDPITEYTEWILDSGKDDDRIPLDWDRIRAYFSDRIVVVDEMYGAGRGYLPRLLGEIGVRHTVLHGERNPNLPGLDYANPEEPFLEELKEKVRETDAILGLGLDTDADRFGVVDQGGVFFRPNQILPMLVRYLRVDRGFTGRVIATQTGSPLIEVLAGMVPEGLPNRRKDENRENEPLPNVLPAYVNHPFYRLRIGRHEDRVQTHTFLVPVGIKYIEEQRRTDRGYRSLKPLPPGWRDVILIGGEESSGLTTRGHVTDKDGIWADLLVMDMLAYYGTQGTHEGKKLHSIDAIWQDTTALEGCWVSYGGVEDEGPNSGRVDVDAVLEAKEGLINFYLDFFTGEDADVRKPLPGMDGLEIVYLGGIRYDLVEMQLRDPRGDDRHFLRIRASGTEPINRIYAESSDRAIARQIIQAVLDTLEDLSVAQIKAAHSEWRLVDVLTATTPSPKLITAARERIAETGWSQADVVSKIRRARPALERRNQRVADGWVATLE